MYEHVVNFYHEIPKMLQMGRYKFQILKLHSEWIINKWWVIFFIILLVTTTNKTVKFFKLITFDVNEKRFDFEVLKKIQGIVGFKFLKFSNILGSKILKR